MSWFNTIGTIAVGAVVVLALVAVYEIIFRTPRGRHAPHQDPLKDSAPATARTPGAGRARQFKRSNGTDR